MEDALALVNIAGFGDRGVHQLSGGQRQRVALARALIAQSDMLLLDKPLSALDLELRRQLQGELKRVQRRTGTTFVLVTHDQEEAIWPPSPTSTAAAAWPGAPAASQFA